MSASHKVTARRRSRCTAICVQLFLAMALTISVTPRAEACGPICKIHRAEASAAAAAASAATAAAAAGDAAAKAAEAALVAQAQAAFAALVAQSQADFNALAATDKIAQSSITMAAANVKAAANPIVTPFTALITGCMANMASSAGDWAQAQSDITTTGVDSSNAAFDASEDQQCAQQITALGNALAAAGGKIGATELAGIGAQLISQSKAALNTPYGACIAGGNDCIVADLAALGDDYLKAEIQSLVQSASSTFVNGMISPLTSYFTAFTSPSSPVFAPINRVIRGLTTDGGVMSPQAQADVYTFSRWLGNPARSVGIYASFCAGVNGVNMDFKFINAIDTASGQFYSYVMTTATVGLPCGPAIGILLSPYSMTTTQQLRGDFVGVPLYNFMSADSCNFTAEPSWPKPTLTKNLVSDISTIKNMLSKVPTLTFGISCSIILGQNLMSYPVGPTHVMINSNQGITLQ